MQFTVLTPAHPLACPSNTLHMQQQSGSCILIWNVILKQRFSKNNHKKIPVTVNVVSQPKHVV